MSKIIDITDKLKFEEKPKFMVKGVEFEANNDAITIIKVTALLEDEGDLLKAYDLLFDKENQEIVESLKLDMDDFIALIHRVATSVVNGDEEPEGETPTPATT